MKALLVLLTTITAAIPALAAETKLTSAEIAELLTDQSLYAGNPGDIEQMFKLGGATFYLDHGNSSQGIWSVANDQYCSTWPPNPSSSCYDVLRDGDNVTFVSKSGTRYPMRIRQ
jgi:hypothetical protein